MTADAFAVAARAEAKRLWRSNDSLGDDSGPIMDFAQHMAEWARNNLPRQEADDDALEAAALAVSAVDDGGCALCARGDAPCGLCIRYARAALTA